MLEDAIDEAQEQGVEDSFVFVVALLFLLPEKYLAGAFGVLALLFMDPGYVHQVKGSLPLPEVALDVVDEVYQVLQNLGQGLLLDCIDRLDQVFLHGLGDLDGHETDEQRHDCPGQHEEAGLPCLVLKHKEQDEIRVEDADKHLNSKQLLVEFEVVAIETEEEFGEDDEIAEIGQVHDNQEEDGEVEVGVVHHVDHRGYFDDQFAQAVPVVGAGHEVVREGVATVVVHHVVGTNYHQPHEV